MWSDTGRVVRFFGIDWRASLLLLLVMYHVSYWTVGLSVFCIGGLVLLEQRKLTLPIAWRAFMVLLMGPYRPAHEGRYRRRSDR